MLLVRRGRGLLRRTVGRLRRGAVGRLRRRRGSAGPSRRRRSLRRLGGVAVVRARGGRGSVAAVVGPGGRRDVVSRRGRTIGRTHVGGPGRGAGVPVVSPRRGVAAVPRRGLRLLMLLLLLGWVPRPRLGGGAAGLGGRILPALRRRPRPPRGLLRSGWRRAGRSASPVRPRVGRDRLWLRWWTTKCLGLRSARRWGRGFPGSGSSEGASCRSQSWSRWTRRRRSVGEGRRGADHGVKFLVHIDGTCQRSIGAAPFGGLTFQRGRDRSWFS